MTQDESVGRNREAEEAARLLAQALQKIREIDGSDQDEVKARISALERTTAGLDQQLLTGREQQAVISQQLTTLAHSLNRLVDHLQGLSHSMGDLLERVAEPATEPSREGVADSAEPAFQAGGEGVSLIISGDISFQALMDIQKSLISMSEVGHASVERFQEGESRIQVALLEPLTAAQFLRSLNNDSSHNLSVEEAQPELSRLRVKALPNS